MPSLMVLIALLLGCLPGTTAFDAIIRLLLPSVDSTHFGHYIKGNVRTISGFLYYSDNCIPNYQRGPWILLTKLSNCLSEGKLPLIDDGTVIIIADETTDVRQLNTSISGTYNHGGNVLAVMVSTAAGEYFIHLIKDDPRPPFVYIIPHESPTQSSIFVLALACIIMFVIISVLAAGTYVKRDQPQTTTIIKYPYAVAVSKIPSQEVTDINDPKCSDYNTCSICIDTFKINDVVSVLPCNHLFHKECIEPWFLEEGRRVCPMCKMDVIKFFGHINYGSEESIVDISLAEDMISIDEQVITITEQ